jgi:hypothetical protein
MMARDSTLVNWLGDEATKQAMIGSSQGHKKGARSRRRIDANELACENARPISSRLGFQEFDGRPTIHDQMQYPQPWLILFDLDN